MKTKINARLLFTYSIFIFIILGISIFFLLKFRRIDNVFKVSVKEYELIVKINKLKVKYFNMGNITYVDKDELVNLNNEIENIRTTVKELSLKEKGFEEIYRNIIDNNLIYGDIYNFIDFTEKTLNNLYNLHLKEMDYINRTISMFIFLALLFGIILMIYFSSYISGPVVKLRKVLKKNIDDIDISEFESINTGDEIEFLAKEFYFLINELRESRKKLQNTNINLEKELLKKIEHINEINKRIYHSKKLSALGSLVAGIAHEIKNPLNVISNILYNFDSSDKDAIKIVLEQVGRIDKLVSGFLDYARIEKYQKKDIDISSNLENIIVFFRKAAKDINIIFEKEGDNFNIFADCEKIEQALLNLFMNSKNALKDKEYKEIFIKLTKKDEKINIIFKDNGNGIDNDIIDRIFDPFFTTGSQGTGLGLSMVYNVVNMHNGNITVNSQKGNFCEFVIQLGGANE
ncbi:MAG: ATP-binding protein [Candidatus Muirbacterium halophilum]|nr:ATP-binding protein [Candidatus Muirbacterium halophilum]MCK9475380.1 ATP-binding protein [Candidatus Muirbacterium halophilum]